LSPSIGDEITLSLSAVSENMSPPSGEGNNQQTGTDIYCSWPICSGQFVLWWICGQ